VDDSFRAEPRATADDGKRAAWEAIHEIVGWPYDADKSVPAPVTPDAPGREFEECPSEMKVLGLHVELAGEGVRISLPSDKAVKWRRGLQEHLKSGALTAAEAATWAGRLGFAGQNVFGRVGRAMLRPLVWRQLNGGSRLTRRLRWALEWWVALLLGRNERMIPLKAPSLRPVHIWSDAEGSGQIGAVLQDPAGSGDPEWWAAAIPDEIRRKLKRRATNIGAYELIAPLVALATWGPRLRGRVVVFWVDNTWAQNAMVKGWDRAEDMCHLVGHFWLSCARSRISPWVQRVPSAQNPADPVSRGRREWARGQGWREVEPASPVYLWGPWDWPRDADWLATPCGQGLP
jgi:hypothetical protein